jgi:tRNA (cmo5U34)-methyltransferase
VGYDLSAGMLAQVRSKLAQLASRVHFIEADIGQAVFAGPFDVVVSAIAVHHVPPRAKPALFRRLYEALCPGGVLILGDTFRAVTPELDKCLAGNGGRRLRGAPLLRPASPERC